MRLPLLLVLSLSFLGCHRASTFEAHFLENQSVFDQAVSGLITNDSLRSILKEESRFWVRSGQEEALLFDGKGHSNRELDRCFELMREFQVRGIIKRVDRIIFDFDYGCFEALYFIDHNELFQGFGSKWNQVIDQHWVLQKGECFGIE